MSWKFRKNLKPIYLDCRLHDAIDDGYILPEDLLEDEEQISEVLEAMNLLQSLEVAMMVKGLIIRY